MVTIEEASPVQDALVENATFDPDTLILIEDIELREYSIDSSSICAISSKLGHRLYYAFPRLKSDKLGITAKGNIEACCCTADFDMPDTYEEKILFLKDSALFRNLLDPQEIWDSAVDIKEVKFAIALMAEKMGGITLPDFTIGRHFLASLRKNQAIGGQFSTATLTKCAQVLSGAEGITINEFKYEAVGNKAARIRVRPADGAGAYRVHIPSGALGLRLMLWKLESNRWEFANVGPKNEEMIEMG
jgi:hypothetical protein